MAKSSIYCGIIETAAAVTQLDAHRLTGHVTVGMIDGVEGGYSLGYTEHAVGDFDDNFPPFVDRLLAFDGGRDRHSPIHLP